MEFTVTSGKLRVSDPCYDREIGAADIIENVKIGKWRGYVDIRDERGWGTRVTELTIAQENYLSASKMWVQTKFNVGVDSGQAGFFDDAHYPDFPQENDFYDIISEGTISDNKCAVVPFGIASSSGYGDGLYECYVAKNIEGEVIAAKIVFISDNDYGDEGTDYGDDDYPLEEEF